MQILLIAAMSNTECYADSASFPVVLRDYAASSALPPNIGVPRGHDVAVGATSTLGATATPPRAQNCNSTVIRENNENGGGPNRLLLLISSDCVFGEARQGGAGRRVVWVALRNIVVTQSVGRTSEDPTGPGRLAGWVRALCFHLCRPLIAERRGVAWRGSARCGAEALPRFSHLAATAGPAGQAVKAPCRPCRTDRSIYRYSHRR